MSLENKNRKTHFDTLVYSTFLIGVLEKESDALISPLEPILNVQK